MLLMLLPLIVAYLPPLTHRYAAAADALRRYTPRVMMRDALPCLMPRFLAQARFADFDAMMIFAYVYAYYATFFRHALRLFFIADMLRYALLLHRCFSLPPYGCRCHYAAASGCYAFDAA